MSEDNSTEIMSKVKFKQLAMAESYGSMSATNSTEETTASEEDDARDFQRSFHLGMSRMNRSNIWTSVRQTESFMEHGDEYKTVPTHLADNVKLVMDPNLNPKEQGSLYYSEDAYYNKDVDPQYALTVNTDIYQRMVAEMSDSHAIPCGLYFCCHGGDMAHSGISHLNYVDIRLAWVLVASMFVAMLVLSWAIPWPNENGNDSFQ